MFLQHRSNNHNEQFFFSLSYCLESSSQENNPLPNISSKRNGVVCMLHQQHPDLFWSGQNEGQLVLTGSWQLSQSKTWMESCHEVLPYLQSPSKTHSCQALSSALAFVVLTIIIGHRLWKAEAFLYSQYFSFTIANFPSTQPASQL